MTIVPILQQLGRKHRLDPRALIAVARGEGGLANRANDVGDLAGGGSYGPFQLYTKGALPARYRGNPQTADAWAWSPQGIDYALGKMAEVGAGGLTGASAVERIIRRFERPADPDKSVRNALARLASSGGGSASNTGASLPMTSALGGGADLQTPAAMQSSRLAPLRQDPRRAILLKGLTKGEDIYDIIQRMGTTALAPPVMPVQHGPTRAIQAAGAPPRPAPARGHAGHAHGPANPAVNPSQNTSDPGGFVPEFEKRLNRMVADSGGRLKITSGYRSQAHQAQLFKAAVAKYGSEAAARKWVAPPGKSKHGVGMAADLGGDLDWAHRNARKYGLHFPMSWEKWHVELFGSRD